MKQFGLRIITGRDRSLVAVMVRAGLAVIEPVYSVSMRLRNGCFDLGLRRIHDLGRPTISAGNITTGGTGKTPVVLWLANRLRERGYHPAVLLRGYGSKRAGNSDEQQLLDEALNAGSSRPIPVMANPSRVDGAADVLRGDPEVDVFILDDGFQHRKARRDFDLVLISATEPFGHGHVLPRGLLREPLSGLKRATAFMITRSSQANTAPIEATLRTINPAAPVFRSDHVHSGIWVPASKSQLPMDAMAGQKIFVIAGIGDPESFAKQLASAGCEIAGHRWFADHHSFTSADIEAVARAAAQAGAGWLITTRKDWVKLEPFFNADDELRIGVVELSIEMSESDERLLIEQILNSIVNSDSKSEKAHGVAVGHPK